MLRIIKVTYTEPEHAIYAALEEFNAIPKAKIEAITSYSEFVNKHISYYTHIIWYTLTTENAL